jgi:hypothetical protein
MIERRISRERLVEILDVDEGFVLELEEHAIVSADPRGTYGGVEIERVRVCWTMHHQLGVNMAGLDVALQLLDGWRRDRESTRALLEKLRAELDADRTKSD